MYSVSVNNATIKAEISINNNKVTASINEKEIDADVERINPYEFHLLINNKSYNVQVLKTDFAEKKIVLKINGSKYVVSVKDKYDELLHSLGLDNIVSKKISHIKAPMPGMVLSVLVHEGQEVKKGDSLIILEAMKMENILKSPTDGIIKKIVAVKGSAVEKNQMLVQF